MGKTENVFMLDSKDTRVGNSKSSVSNRLFSFSSEPETNFDITADWSLLGVSDQASFELYLTLQGATSVLVTYFDLSVGRLRAFINVAGLSTLSLAESNLVNINKLSGFDVSFEQLILSFNQLTFFNPSIALPTTLIDIQINDNLITTAGYIESESWATSQLSFTSTCAINFSNNVNSITGTTLEAILLTKNTTITP